MRTGKVGAVLADLATAAESDIAETALSQNSAASVTRSVKPERAPDVADGEFLGEARRSGTTGWSLVRLVGFFPGGIRQAGLQDGAGQPVTQDYFRTGNPFWIYELQTPTGERVYGGPDDARQVLPELRTQLDRLQAQNRQTRTEAGHELARAQRALGWLGLELSPETAPLLGAPDKLGDPQLDAVRGEVARAELAWGEGMPGELNEFHQATAGLRQVAGYGKTLLSLKTGEVNWLKAQLARLDTGGPLEFSAAEKFLALHQRLLGQQNALARESLSWGARRATAVGLDYEAKTPAFHANLWSLHWLLGQPNAEALDVLDVGANHSVGYRVAERLEGRLGQIGLPIWKAIVRWLKTHRTRGVFAPT